MSKRNPIALVTALLLLSAMAQGATDDSIEFTPIQHATFVIQSTQATIFVDPVGEPSAFETFGAPDIILITDIHRDHLDAKVVRALAKEETVVIGPKAVIDQLEKGEVLANGGTKAAGKITIEAIPMYNLTEGRLKFHEKGRGNGYVVTIDGKRVYISGDTEDIPEMRALENIDYAFVCMNLPYTMTVEQAASAVLEMEPKVVIPYHYRGTDGFSDVEHFKKLVSKNKAIEVRLLKWYD